MVEDHDTVKAHVSSIRLRNLLLAMPNEIVVDVLSSLSPTDFSALRLTDHTFHNLIHKHERTLAQRYMQPYYSAVGGFPNLLGDIDFSHIFAFMRRLESVSCLADFLSAGISSKLEVPDPPVSVHWEHAGKLIWRRRKSAMLQHRLKPLLFVLFEFFLRLRESIAEAATYLNELTREEYAEVGQVFELDQQNILETLPPDMLPDATQAWLILQAVCAAEKFPMSRHSRTFPFTSLRTMLAYGGLRHLTNLLAATHPQPAREKNRETAFEEMNACLWRPNDLPAQRSFFVGDLLPTIQHIRRLPGLGNFASASARLRQDQADLIERQEIWTDPAFAVMQRQGTLGPQESLTKTDQWIRLAIAEDSDPEFSLAGWRRP